MFTFRQCFEKESSTYTYLIGDPKTHEAVLIDPVLSEIERDRKLLGELGYRLKYVLDTHVHADHVSSLGRLRELTGCQTGLSDLGGTHCADLKLKEGDVLKVGEFEIKVLETPGHTPGCLTFNFRDRLFTGDALLIRGCGRTDFQGGSAETLYNSLQKLLRFPDETFVFPAHDYQGFTCSTIGEERRWNPRLQKPREEFIAYMRELKLPPPKMIQTAVPANVSCGKDLPVTS